jgi:hypothetical protein
METALPSKTYKTPPRKLARFFEKSRNRWKDKYREAKRTVKRLKNRVRFLEKEQGECAQPSQRTESGTGSNAHPSPGFGKTGGNLETDGSAFSVASDQRQRRLGVGSFPSPLFRRTCESICLNGFIRRRQPPLCGSGDADCPLHLPVAVDGPLVVGRTTVAATLGLLQTHPLERAGERLGLDLWITRSNWVAKSAWSFWGFV